MTGGSRIPLLATMALSTGRVDSRSDVSWVSSTSLFNQPLPRLSVTNVYSLDDSGGLRCRRKRTAGRLNEGAAEDAVSSIELCRPLIFPGDRKASQFRRAALELDISASALSHALRGLEERLGLRLLNRTSRSVKLTAAGEALQSALVRPFDEINIALDVLNRFRDTPTGRVRLSVPTEAAKFLIGPVIATFLDKYPEVEIEFSVNNRMIDVVESGFDAGIRYGGTVPQDMIAQRLSADIRWLVVGAPSYFEQHGAPVHPNDLQSHRCVRIRIGDDRIYRWEHPCPFRKPEVSFRRMNRIALGDGSEPPRTHDNHKTRDHSIGFLSNHEGVGAGWAV